MPKKKAKSDRPEVERRRSERIRKHQHAEAQLLNETGETFSVQLMNISDGGVRFVAARPFPIDEQVRFVLSGRSRLTTIRRCRKMFGGYSIHAEFV